MNGVVRSYRTGRACLLTEDACEPHGGNAGKSQAETPELYRKLVMLRSSSNAEQS